MHVHCDVLVVGGGPAGISAALSAGESGARVVLVDEHATLGGVLPGLRHRIDGTDGAEWAAQAAERLAAMPEVRVLTRTTLFGYYDHNTLSALERRSDHLGPRAPAGTSRQRLWTVKAERVVLATGAHERPLVFADNDRPGILLASAAQRYLNDHAALPGRRALLFTNNDAAYEAARDIVDAGGKVAAVVDSRPEPAAPLAPALKEAGVALHTGSVIAATHGAKRCAPSPSPRSARTARREAPCAAFAATASWSRAAGARRCISSASRAASWNSRRHAGCFCRARPRRPWRSRAPPAAASALARVWRKAPPPVRRPRKRRVSATAARRPCRQRMRPRLAPSRRSGSCRGSSPWAMARPSTWSTTRTT